MKQEEITGIKNNYLYKNSNKLWNDSHLNQRRYIGSVSETAKKFLRSGQEITLENFENFFYKNNITRQELELLAVKFATYMDEHSLIHISNEMAFKWCWIRIIYDSFVGLVLKEQETKERLETYGFFTEYTSWEDDCEFGVDLYDETCGIQVKPYSFLMSLKYRKDFAMVAFNENNLKHKKYKHPVFWVFYQENDILIYTLDELLSEVGL